MLLKKELISNQYVCKHCDHHFRITAKERLELFLGKNYMVMDTPKIKPDPLNFRDSKKYIDRLKVAQKKNQTNDSVIVASGTINGKKIVAAVFDFNFMGGSMGMAAGEAIITACDFAKKNLLPLIIFSSSGGARMQEGILSLMQMARIFQRIEWKMIGLRWSRGPFVFLGFEVHTETISQGHSPVSATELKITAI